MKKPYSFEAWSWFVNGIKIQGFAKGDDCVTLKRRSDSFSDDVGADGQMSIYLSADQSGEITFKLAPNSNSNTYLGTIMALQEGGPTTFIPVRFFAKDQALQDVGVGTIGYLKKPSDIGRGMKPSDNEWTIVVERLDMEYAGATIFDL